MGDRSAGSTDPLFADEVSEAIATLCDEAGALRAVVACDCDPFHAACTSANLRAERLPALVAVADALRPAVHADLSLVGPDRRALGRRSRRPHEWSPSLEATGELAARHSGACIKLSRALDLAHARRELPDGLAVSPQWVGARSERAELALWTGVLARDGARGDECAACSRNTTSAP
ncbi:MAG: hypothetical protein CMJ84_17495 [Planctomycetes bacterium]|jgi:hypothetical protein|nr:hypothetical protein [Planctomycetota bacterium]MDP6410888.1 hypothetical protein [Planctomycetota bacterium]